MGDHPGSDGGELHLLFDVDPSAPLALASNDLAAACRPHPGTETLLPFSLAVALSMGVMHDVVSPGGFKRLCFQSLRSTEPGSLAYPRSCFNGGHLVADTQRWHLTCPCFSALMEWSQGHKPFASMNSQPIPRFDNPNHGPAFLTPKSRLFDFKYIQTSVRLLAARGQGVEAGIGT